MALILTFLVQFKFDLILSTEYYKIKGPLIFAKNCQIQRTVYNVNDQGQGGVVRYGTSQPSLLSIGLATFGPGDRGSTPNWFAVLNSN